MPERQDQQRLIADYLDGDPASVAILDDWIQRAASSYRRRLGAQWEDVVQEVRLEVYQLLQAGRFRGDSNLRTYLWRVVAHSCLDALRSQQRWKWAPLDDQGETGVVFQLEAQPDRPSQETADLLLKVLGQTSEDCRRLWQMILEGHSYREMSRELGHSEGALRVRVLRCRKKAIEIRAELLGGDAPGV